MSTLCRHCGQYYKVESSSGDRGGFGLSSLFKRRKNEKGGYLQPNFGPQPTSRDRVAVRAWLPREPLPGEGTRLPGGGDEGRGEGAVAGKEVPGEDTDRGEGEIGSADEEQAEEEAGGAEEDLGTGYDLIHVEPLAPPGGPGDGAAVRALASSLPERETRCFDCGAPVRYHDRDLTVSCKRCGTRISLEDVEVRDHRRENLKMRGDLTIHHKASLSAGEIACETLRVYGRVSGRIDCHGDAFFRSSGKVVGRVRCRHLYVHKLAELTFVPGVRAETAEVHGKVEGDLICEGTIRISSTGVVLGDCTAPAIQLESGGVLSGQMKIAKPDQVLAEEFGQRAEVARGDFLAEGDWEGELRKEEPGSGTRERPAGN